MQKDLYFCNLAYFLEFISLLTHLDYFPWHMMCLFNMLFIVCLFLFFTFKKIFLNYTSKYLLCIFILVFFFRNFNYVYVASPLSFFFTSFFFYLIFFTFLISNLFLTMFSTVSVCLHIHSHTLFIFYFFC